MRVLLVTTWQTACGIAEHSALLKDAVEPHGVTVVIQSALHPAATLAPCAVRIEAAAGPVDLVHLNYHAALHSQWTPEAVQQVQALGCPIVITYHDSGVPNSEQCRALHAVADAFVVHEPCEDLPGAIYWRQGIPSPARAATSYRAAAWKRWSGQPVVGTVGFPFGWKNFGLLAEASREAGWACLILAPGATDAQVAEWTALNPASLIVSTFTDRVSVVEDLAGCDATAFLYSCANTGTSGAIRQGIAARKPVLATHPDGCRQFRDLGLDPVGQAAIRWLPTLTVDAVADALSRVVPGPVDSRVVRLAEQDSWVGLGARYAALYRSLAEGRRG